jgi:tellurite resistance protein TehA-like permease
VQPAQSNGRRTLLTGVAIGIFITGVPSAMVAASAGGVIAKDEAQVLFTVGIIWAIAVAVAAFAYPISYYRRKEHGIRQTGRQAL